MTLNAPKRSGLKLGGFRIKRRYLIVATLLAAINLVVFLMPGTNWDSTIAGRYLLPLLGQALLVVLAVAGIAALVAAIKIFLVRKDG